MNWDVMNFKVVMASKPAISKATMRIGLQKISFSSLAACEMGYPPFVQMLISPDATKMVICPYDQEDNTSIPFFVEKYSKKQGRYIQPNTVSISDKDLVQDIRKKLGWGNEAMSCTPLRFREQPNCLFFELNKAIPASELKRARKMHRTIDSYPTLTAFAGLAPIALPQVVNA